MGGGRLSFIPTKRIGGGGGHTEGKGWGGGAVSDPQFSHLVAPTPSYH